tara:strand:- start:9 stop:902 length:894 start_codon:yes stop_codon:yes gene_type:complete
MKQVFLLFFLIILNNCISAQNYYQLTKNVGWCLEDYFGTGSTLSAYENNGDTLLNNFTYKKITKDGYTTTLLREDSIQKKAWVILPDSTTETLIYDFNLVTGNQITLDYVNYPQITYLVDSIDIVATPLGNRKRINLSTTNTTLAPTLTWIEGLGSTYGPIYLLDKTFASGPLGGSGYCLICCYQDIGVQSYLGSCGINFGSLENTKCDSFITSIKDSDSKNSSINIYFPTSNLLLIKSEKELIKSIRVFNIEGKLVEQNKCNNKQFSIQTNKWNSGIYFINITLDNNQVLSQKIIK